MVRTGDMVRYATITIASHGYLIKLNSKFEFPVKVSGDNVSLENLSSPISISLNEMEKMILDTRFNPSGTQYIMVYPASKSEDEVVKMLNPQVRVWLMRLRKAYETLLDNIDEMVVAIDGGHDDHICKPMKAI